MNKVQKIFSEIQTRKLCTMDEHMAFYNDKAEEDYRFLSEIEGIIKALQEEPVSNPIDFEQELYKAFGQVKDFTLGMRIAKWFYDMGKKSREPISDDLEEAACLYYDKNRLPIPPEWDLHKEFIDFFKAGAKSQFERVKEALLSEVLPCFMHGGEADEVVAKLDEVLNQKK